MVTVTATAVLEEFPAEFHRLQRHDRDKDAIGLSQFIAYYLLVGVAVRALRRGKLWRDLPPEKRERMRVLAAEFLPAAASWEQLSLRERWAAFRTKPRETAAVNILWPKTRALANAILGCTEEEQRRASVIADIYASGVPCLLGDASEAYITLSSEQIRSRNC